MFNTVKWFLSHVWSRFPEVASLATCQFAGSSVWSSAAAGNDWCVLTGGTAHEKMAAVCRSWAHLSEVTSQEKISLSAGSPVFHINHSCGFFWLCACDNFYPSFIPRFYSLNWDVVNVLFNTCWHEPFHYFCVLSPFWLCGRRTKLSF